MTVRSFYILLTFLLILLPFTVLQATEYRKVNTKVKAKGVLKQIETGEEVNYKDSLIVWELNAIK